MSGLLARRALLTGAGCLGLGTALSACTGGSSRSPASASASAYSGEYRYVALSAALENQAVAFYRAVLTAEHHGKLGGSAPALVSLAQTCAEQHAAHARAWNSVLHAAHRPVVSGIPLASQAGLMRKLDSATVPGAAVALAYKLENQAAGTFASVAGHVNNAEAVTAAASIAPVEAMHAAILRFMLGESPVPEDFADSSAIDHDLMRELHQV